MTRHRSPIAFLCVLLLGAVGCDSSRATPGPVPGYRGSIDGFELSAYTGRVVILNFWATWCGPCRVEIPDLVRLRKAFSEEDLAIIGISVDARGRSGQIEAQLKKFIDRFEINYPIYLDGEQKFAAAYDPAAGYMRFVPTTVIIDQQGRIHDTHFGVPRNAAGKVDPFGVLGAQVQTLLDGA
jgi:peroxiredoxin